MRKKNNISGGHLASTFATARRDRKRAKAPATVPSAGGGVSKAPSLSGPVGGLVDWFVGLLGGTGPRRWRAQQKDAERVLEVWLLVLYFSGPFNQKTQKGLWNALDDVRIYFGSWRRGPPAEYQLLIQSTKESNNLQSLTLAHLRCMHRPPDRETDVKAADPKLCNPL